MGWDGVGWGWGYGGGGGYAAILLVTAHLFTQFEKILVFSENNQGIKIQILSTFGVRMNISNLNSCDYIEQK